MAASFDRVDTGERIFIRRKSKLYTIVPVDADDIDITPALLAKIDKARKEHNEGKALKFSNASAAQQWMDEL